MSYDLYPKVHLIDIDIGQFSYGANRNVSGQTVTPPGQIVTLDLFRREGTFNRMSESISLLMMI